MTKRRVRCPNCGSLDTKRKARQGPRRRDSTDRLSLRDSCVDRAVAASLASASPRARARGSLEDVVGEAVRLYIQGRSSYRVLATMLERRLGLSVSRFTSTAGFKSSGPEPRRPLRSRPSSPAVGSFLGNGGRAIYVRGDKHCLLIGVDHGDEPVGRGSGEGEAPTHEERQYEDPHRRHREPQGRRRRARRVAPDH